MSDLRIIPPSREIRGVDAFGSGAFGARRSRWTAGAQLNAKVEYEHKGTDFVVVPGSYIPCPCTAWIVRVGKPYADDDRYQSIHLEADEDGDWQLKVFYAALIYKGGLPFRVDSGVPFAEAQDLRWRYPGITPHVHLECRHRGALVDPATILMEQA